MANKLFAIINSLKVPKIKKILLYRMKFLVPNYSCLQNPWQGLYRPKIAVPTVLCPQLNLLNPPPRIKFLGTPLLALLTPLTLYKPKVHHRLHNSPQHFPIRSQISPVYAIHSIFWRSILILSPHQCLGLVSGSFRRVSPPKPCRRLSPLPVA